MAIVLSCPQGHQWEPRDDWATGATGPAVCPVCGTSVEATVAYAEAANPETNEGRSTHPTQLPTGASDVTATLPGEATRPALRKRFPTIAGYEILAELGHGGMGVVYKAVQVSLKRPVALKMVLAGGHADKEQLARFRTEAEAVARLQHPNIVQIHEIGEADVGTGSPCPYMSMEYVDGGGLDKRLAGQPQPPYAAAELVEQLARAIHYAHQRGIVHRDLKPANVLLASGGREPPVSAAETGGSHPPLAGGAPKITDFGLAKQLDGDSGQTKSGAIMGTPSYMAPEQAEGRIHEVGPLTDVYALGAILYETLTGRPPFRGTTSADTMRQVLTQEVTPPSRLRPRLPRDLETICLKALARLPESRYQSAQALAEDLARFRAGEAILARRESVLARLWRKTKRRAAVVTVVGSVVAVASAVVLYFVFKDSLSSQADQLTQDLNQRMEATDWPAGRLAELEGMVAELERLDADRAGKVRERLLARYEAVIRDSFAPQRHPLLYPADVARIEAELTELERRRPEVAGTVRDAFRARLRNPNVWDVRGPSFAKLAEVTKSPALKVDGTTLLVQQPAGAPPWIVTEIPCLGQLELEVGFGPNWEAATELALQLNGPQGGYSFVLKAPAVVVPTEETTPAPAPASFAAARQARKPLSLQIIRGGALLREQVIDSASVPTGPLTLVAARDGGRLTFQLNQLTPVVFFDTFPLAGTNPGVFALQAPDGTRLERLRISNQALPAAPSPLERGDELYARGQFQEALTSYRQQDPGSASSLLGQEVRYKIADCLSRLTREDEADALFEEIATSRGLWGGRALKPLTGEPLLDRGAEPGSHWVVLAACRLWVNRLKQGRLEDVDTIMLSLTSRFTSEQLASAIPAEVRSHVVSSYSVQTLGPQFARFDPSRVAKLERVIPLADLLRANEYERLHLRLSLVRAYHFAGQRDRGIEEAEKILKDPALAGDVNADPNRLLHWIVRACEEYGWLMRLEGKPAQALAEIDRRLFQSPGVTRPGYGPLFLERARLHAAMNNWAHGESDLNKLDELVPRGTNDYRYQAESALLRGFLLFDVKKDPAGAARVWEGGTYQNWVTEYRRANPNGQLVYDRLPFLGTQVVNDYLLAGLAGKLTQADVDHLSAMAIGFAFSNQAVPAFKDVLKFPVARLNAVWQSDRGRDAARKFALKNVPWPEFVRLAIIPTGASIILEEGLPERPTKEQEDIAWQLTDEVYTAYFQTGKLGGRHLFPLGMAWKGSTGSFGWAGVAPHLEPSLRAPFAYVLGHRYLKLGKQKEALDFFQTASKDAPADSQLRKLAQAEIERLDRK